MSVALIASQPIWLKFSSIFLGTFILEDPTTILAALASQKSLVSQPVALIALYAGVFLGDLLLYALGMQTSKWRWLQKYLRLTDLPVKSRWSWKNVWGLVFIARFTLGARAPIYTTSGLCKIPFVPFAFACLFATLVWTTILFKISLYCGDYLLSHQDYWHEIAVGGFLIGVLVSYFVIRILHNTSSSKEL